VSGEARGASRDPIIALVVARGENGAIGVGGDLPWRLSTDLKQFRKVTLGKPVIMGRRTFMSVMAYNLEEAMDVARKEAAKAGVDEIMVIGGDDVFRAVMPMAKRIYLTEVHAAPDADTWLKDFNLKDWRELSRERHEPGPKDEYPFSFVILERS
jgi:dihydrofolate reductase